MERTRTPTKSSTAITTIVETVDVRFDETNGSQREQLPSDPDKQSPEEAIKLKATEDIVPTKEIAEEIIPALMKIKKMLLRNLLQNQFLSPDEILNQLIRGLQMKWNLTKSSMTSTRQVLSLAQKLHT